MSDIRARVAYLHGLAEGMGIDASSAEGRVLSSVIDVLGEFAEELTEITDAQKDLHGYVEDLDYDLGALEESVYEEEQDSIRFIPAVDSDDADANDVDLVCECTETNGSEHQHAAE